MGGLRLAPRRRPVLLLLLHRRPPPERRRASPDTRPAEAAAPRPPVSAAAFGEPVGEDGLGGGGGDRGGAAPGGRGGHHGGQRRHCEHGAARRADRGLVPPQHLLQHLQQAGAAGIALPLHHHRLPARLRLPRHPLHVGGQAAPAPQALRRAAGEDRAAGRRAHAGHGVHQHEPGRRRRLLHAHHQGLRALLHRPALRLLPRRVAFAAGAGLSGADRRRRRARISHRSLLQLGRILERHGVESAEPDEERAQQAPSRRRRGGIHGRHKPLLAHHRAVLPAVLPSHAAHGRGQVLPCLPTHHRPEPPGTLREGGSRWPLLPWLPEDLVYDLGEGVPRDPLCRQLRQARGGHRVLGSVLQDAHLPCQCARNWCCSGGSLPVLQAQEE